jgi:glycosyltransferase involved in cell wall biosynthesis
MPHFGCEEFLGEAVDSILRQDLDDLVLVVADDASPTDRWRDVLGTRTRDPRLVLFRSDRNVGPYRLKNRLLEGVQSPFVAFQDADDRSHPARLRKQVLAIQRTGCVAVGCSFSYLSSQGILVRRKRMIRNVNLWICLGRSFVTLHGSMLVRRTALDELGGFDGTTHFGGDSDFTLRAAHLGRIRNLPDPLYDYRLRGTSLTGSSHTGLGSTARAEYARRMWMRERERRALPKAERHGALRAPVNDTEFVLTRLT